MRRLAIVMNGRVIERDHLDAVVHEEGQLIDLATLHFQGLIRIMPAMSRRTRHR